MAAESSSSSGGIGFFGLLAIVFITLKLTGCISWSWFWVLSPLLVPIGIVLLVLGFFMFCAIVSTSHARR
jgi:hypothetical protein